MANGRSRGKRGDSSRDPGGFVALPWSVMDCPAYAELSHPAKSLLLEIARQYVRDNNGRLLTSMAYLKERGFIHETVMGHRPNKASWYAVTWYALDKLNGYDPGAAESFERGAYRGKVPLKNTSLKPSHGADRPAIAPSHGIERSTVAPAHGAMSSCLAASPRPSHGNHLDMPSPDAKQQALQRDRMHWVSAH